MSVHQALRFFSPRGRIAPRSTTLYPALSQLEATLQSRPGVRALSATIKSSRAALLGALKDRFGSSPAQTRAAKALVVKLINLCLAKQHFLARDPEIASRPLALVFDPSNSCNLACPGCVHSARAEENHWFDWKPGNLSAARLDAFLDRYGPPALQVTLCNYGEPLANQHTPQFIRKAKSHLLRTLLSTTISLPRFDPEAYVESGLDQMILSIDGATQAIYERFRRKGNFELVLNNVRRLVEAKRRSGRRTPVLTWRFLAFQHNVHEIPAAVELAKELGVDEFCAEPAWDIGWDAPEIRPAGIPPVRAELGLDVFAAISENWNPFPESLNAAAIERDFEALSSLRLAEPPDNPRPGSTCEWLYKSITMDAGGRILPCCSSPRPGAELVFGTLDPQTNTEVFHSEMFGKARAFFGDRGADSAGSAPTESGADLRQPFCVECPWSKISEPSPSQIHSYFAGLDSGLFDAASLDLLSTW